MHLRICIGRSHQWHRVARDRSRQSTDSDDSSIRSTRRRSSLRVDSTGVLPFVDPSLTTMQTIEFPYAEEGGESLMGLTFSVLKFEIEVYGI